MAFRPNIILQGFASRDIKLDNVLLDGSRRPLMKLCDFGYSKVNGQSRDQMCLKHGTQQHCKINTQEPDIPQVDCTF